AIAILCSDLSQVAAHSSPATEILNDAPDPGRVRKRWVAVAAPERRRGRTVAVQVDDQRLARIDARKHAGRRLSCPRHHLPEGAGIGAQHGGLDICAGDWQIDARAVAAFLKGIGRKRLDVAVDASNIGIVTVGQWSELGSVRWVQQWRTSI